VAVARTDQSAKAQRGEEIRPPKLRQIMNRAGLQFYLSVEKHLLV
jgi:hypothetical protein